MVSDFLRQEMNREEDFFHRLDALKSMNLKTDEIDQIKGRLMNLHEQIAVTNILKKGTEICRTVVVNDLEKDIPKHVGQISYNPNPSINFGRANLIGETVFYGSVSTKKMPHYFNTSFEVFDLNNKSLERQYFVTSKWILQQDLPIIVVGNHHLDSEEMEERQHFLDSIQTLPKDILGHMRHFDDFIASEFSKIITRGNEFLYKISACYCSLLFSRGIYGFLYSSVGSNGHGLNVAIKPSLVDDGILIPQTALFGTLYNRYGEYANDYSMKANIEEDILRWQDAYYSLPPSMKRYYTGKSNDKSFQKKITFEDLGGNF